MKKIAFFIAFICISYPIIAEYCPVGYSCSYTQTCSNCSYDTKSKKLTCTCKDKDGHARTSTVQLPCPADKKQIINSGGELICSDEENPYGEY